MEIRWKLHWQVPTCTHLGILIAGEVEEKQELKNLLMWEEFSFHDILDCKIFTYVKIRNS